VTNRQCCGIEALKNPAKASLTTPCGKSEFAPFWEIATAPDFHSSIWWPKAGPSRLEARQSLAFFAARWIASQNARLPAGGVVAKSGKRRSDPVFWRLWIASLALALTAQTHTSAISRRR
jgi:hypothetical protein